MLADIININIIVINTNQQLSTCLCPRRDTGGLLPSPYTGGRAGEMSWCGQLTGWADQLMTVDFNSPSHYIT